MRPKNVFWLNTKNSDEKELLEAIPVLKKERLYTATIRDGMRLVLDLRRGSLDVLFELFPFVRAEFLKYMQDMNQQESLAQELADIKKLLKSPQQVKSDPQKLTLKPVSLPVDDEDDSDLLVVKKDENAGKEASANFVGSLMNLLND